MSGKNKTRKRKPFLIVSPSLIFHIIRAWEKKTSSAEQRKKKGEGVEETEVKNMKQMESAECWTWTSGHQPGPLGKNSEALFYLLLKPNVEEVEVEGAEE